jgi:topoisomerase-4 subunit A
MKKNDTSERCLMASKSGFGFVFSAEEGVTKNKKGKALISVPKGFEALPFQLVDEAADLVVVVSDAGYLLSFALEDLPELVKGKGNKLMAVKSTGAKPEKIAFAAAIAPKQEVRIKCGRKHMNLSYKDIKKYAGERARRGKLLPQGYRKVAQVTLI